MYENVKQLRVSELKDGFYTYVRYGENIEFYEKAKSSISDPITSYLKNRKQIPTSYSTIAIFSDSFIISSSWLRVDCPRGTPGRGPCGSVEISWQSSDILLLKELLGRPGSHY